MAGNCFLATYHPLAQTSCGRQAIREHALLPFIDGSCRREPDFESRFPSVTATCRGRNFAPRLHVGDRVAYLTVKGKYTGDLEHGWRLVAVLRAIQRFSSHDEAASWYSLQNLPLPSNCLVDGNPAKAFDLTNGNPPSEIKRRKLNDPADVIRLWNQSYRKRIKACSVFLATEAEFIELQHPPQLRHADMLEIFGRIPGTLNPPQITPEEMGHLLRLAGRQNGLWSR